MTAEPGARVVRSGPTRLPRPGPRAYASVAAVVLGVWVVVMQVRLTGYALADIMGALGSSPDEAAWVNTVYTVAELLSIPVAGWLSARISTRRVFVPAALGFTVCSLAATQVTHIDQLIVLRALQGLTGGAFIPMATPTFRRKLAYRDRLVAFALYGIAASVPISLAPLIESYFVDQVSWRLLFVPPALLSLLAAGLAAWGMPAAPLPHEGTWNSDWGGTLLLPAGLGLVVLGIDQANRLDWLDSSWVVGMVAAGALTLLSFVVHERLHPKPYFPLGLWRNRNFVLAILSFLVFRASMIAIVWALPDFLQRVEQFRPSDFIDVFAAMVLPQLILPFYLVRLTRKVDLRLTMAAGIAFQAVACLRTATLNNDWAAPELTTIFALHGIGQALFFTPVLVLLTLNLADAHRDAAVTVVNLTRVFGNAAGVALASTFLTKAEHLHHNMLNEYFRPDGPGMAERMTALNKAVVTYFGNDEGGKRALELAARAVRGEAYVLAYGDLFLTIGTILLFVLIAQILLKPISLAELSPRRMWRHRRAAESAHAAKDREVSGQSQAVASP
jgi:DHA2 family multidrug resistance protein